MSVSSYAFTSTSSHISSAAGDEAYFSIIYARSQEGYFSTSVNTLPFKERLSDDMKRFKKVTTTRLDGNPTKTNVLIMGRHTFRSLPKVLPDRITIVITNNSSSIGLPAEEDERKEGTRQSVYIVNNFSRALQKAQEVKKKTDRV